MSDIAVPEGYRLKANGSLVPESSIKDIDLLRDDLVTKVVEQAKVAQQAIAQFKVMAMNEIRDFVDLSAEEYGVKYGGTKGNVSLLSFDGKYKLMRAVGEHRVFDERIQAAKTKIDECIHRWSEGSSDNIKALVEHAFRVNKQGHIDLNAVLGLRSLSIDDADWLEAMDAIADSVQVNGTSTYLRLYERQENGQYKQFPLDISKV